jgi:peptidyl-prolyl cis-trans isomerase SurA
VTTKVTTSFYSGTRLGERFLCLSAIIFVTSLVASLATANTEPLDSIIAIVDDDVVLASELSERMDMVKQNLQQAGQQAPDERIEKEVFDKLISENIQLQMAFRAGVRIGDAQLNDSMQRIAQQNGLPLDQFIRALESEGISYVDTREQVRRDLLLQRVQQGNVNQRVQISDQEIANFLSSEEGQTLTQPEYKLLHALIEVTDSESPLQMEQAGKYADALYQRITAGEVFETVVQDRGPFEITTSDLGWRKASDVPSLFEDLAPTLSTGQTAKPVRSASGYHLIKMAQKRGEGEVIAQTKARHILLKASAIRDEQATEKEINTIRQRIIDGEDFAILAREHSEDIGSALEGGELGWTSPGQLVPQFQQAMDDSTIDQVSPAFRSQYGWHIVQVTERREKDVTEDIRRNIARNFIHQRKFNDELQAWLQKIRDEAYVDIK